MPTDLRGAAGAPGADPAITVVRALRGAGRPRPVADRQWCAGLREQLEDALVEISARRSHQQPLVLTWRSVGPEGAPAPVDPEGAPGTADVARAAGAPAPVGALGLKGAPGTSDIARPARRAGAVDAELPLPARSYLLEALVRVMFRQLVVTGRIGAPLPDALAGLQASGDAAGIARAVAALSRPARAQLAEELSGHRDRLVACWPALDPRWAPRTGERLSTALAGGRIRLSASVDLALGLPARERASVGFVTVTSGSAGIAPRRRLAFAALVETLRAGVAPFQVAVLSSATGSLATLPVLRADLLEQAGLVVARATAGPGPEPSAAGAREVLGAVRAAPTAYRGIASRSRSARALAPTRSPGARRPAARCSR